jgi:hypothetical protein
VLLRNLRKRHSRTAVTDNLFPIDIHGHPSNTPSFQFRAAHPSLYALND